MSQKIKKLAQTSDPLEKVSTSCFTAIQYWLENAVECPELSSYA